MRRNALRCTRHLRYLRHLASCLCGSRALCLPACLPQNHIIMKGDIIAVLFQVTAHALY